MYNIASGIILEIREAPNLDVTAEQKEEIQSDHPDCTFLFSF